MRADFLHKVMETLNVMNYAAEVNNLEAVYNPKEKVLLLRLIVSWKKGTD